MPYRALLGALACALVSLPAPVATGANPLACGNSGYSYAGLLGRAPAAGVTATIRAQTAPEVASGHVAAWIGLGGYGQGPAGGDAWIQTGIISRAGEAPSLYYEVTRPGEEPELVTLRTATLGRTYRFEVREDPERASFWRVVIDGKRIAGPFGLARSHGRWEPTAVAESWDGGRPACNRFSFRFAELGRGFGDATVLADPGYGLSRTAAGFLADSRS